MTSTEPVSLIADLFPGSVIDAETGGRPEGVPATAKLHVIVSTTEIAIGWSLGSVGGVEQIGAVMLAVTEEETALLNHNGGTAGRYTISRAGGCSCGKGLKRWNPYAGRPMTQMVRQDPGSYGLPTSRNYRRG